MSAEHPVDPLNKEVDTSIEGVRIPHIDPPNAEFLEPNSVPPSVPPAKKRCLHPWVLYVILALMIMLAYGIYKGLEIVNDLSTNFTALRSSYYQHSNALSDNLRDYKAENEQHNKQIQDQVAAQALQLHQLSDAHNWRISEASYLVAIAQERLNMVHDIPTTIKLLKTADDRLKNSGDVRTSRVRESIAHDIHTLETKGRFDQIGLWVELGVMRKQIELLSLHTLQGNIEGQPEIIASNPAHKPRTPWKQALDSTWKEVKGLVKVREFNPDKLNVSLESKDQVLLLRAMDLMLIEAQWALLQEEPVVYQQSLDRLEDKLNRYFVQNDAWKKVHDELAVLKTKAIHPLNIDLSKTLNLLKALDSIRSMEEEKPL